MLDSDNSNLTIGQQELLQWHFRLGHFNMEWIQRLLRVREGENDSVLSHKSKANTCDRPQCAACHFAKMKRRSTGSSSEQKVMNKDGILKVGNLKPGDVVSTDQYVSKLLGRLPHTKGKESDSEKYCGGTIYVDEASGFMYVNHQVSLNAAETIQGKHQFEREAMHCGRGVTHYRGDNGVYKSEAFLKDLESRKQTMKFCGVGAHHQNGIAERAIRTVSESARSMLLHAAIHWPENVTLDLWPLAMDYAVWLWNRMPKNSSGIAPIEIFCGTTLDKTILRSAHVFGCPAYVLDPKIQDGNKLPRWEPKSRRGQFLGFSQRHSSTIGLIRNLKTGSISPQFHVVCDDRFTTIPSRLENEQIKQDEWVDLLQFSRLRAIDDEENEEVPNGTLNQDWLTDEEREIRLKRMQRRNIPPRVSIIDEEEQLTDDAVDLPPILPIVDEDDDDGEDEEENEEDEGGHFWEPAHARRVRVPNRRYYNEDFVNVSLQERGNMRDFVRDFGLLTEELAFLAGVGSIDSKQKGSQLRFMELVESMQTDEDGLLDSMHPLAFTVKANNDDTPNFYQAMNGPDSEGFYRAMCDEMETLEKLEPWDIIPDIEVPEGVNILDSTWVFKRKRYPDGSVRKLKARWCVRGDQQIEGVDFFDTYAPVVAWSTTRLLLILSVVLGLATKQVDYTNAFCQADLAEEVYVRMPKLFGKPGHIFRLKKSVYGLKQSPKNFYKTLKEALENRGFEQSQHDPCLFISEKVICLFYVDDCLFFAKNSTDIDDMINSLQRDEPTKLSLNIEDDVAGFLGILLERQEDGSIEMKQTGLIDRILAVMNLEDSKEKSTPAEAKALGKDEDGAHCSESWSYRSVVGMMMYLASNSRPDIAYAVHCCARFSHCPKRSHEIALKRIARYLKKTRTRGMIVKPTDDLSIELYADADYAGLWDAEDPTDPISVKSRSGFVVTLGGVPVFWQSKMQTEIALSTQESEYISLSQGMRSLLPIRALFQSLARSLGIPDREVTKVCQVWEDNSAALKLANSEFSGMTPRTKHIAVKYHWFKSHLRDGIEIKKIDTSVQKADIFTTGLKVVEFEKKRFMIMGW